LAVGIVEQIGEQSSSAHVDAGKHHVERDDRVADHDAALRLAFDLLAEAGIEPETSGLVAVGASGGARRQRLLPANRHRRRADRQAEGAVATGPVAQPAERHCQLEQSEDDFRRFASAIHEIDSARIDHGELPSPCTRSHGTINPLGGTGSREKTGTKE
jgi:hypothetical protein